jgi:hypothetical protein
MAEALKTQLDSAVTNLITIQSSLMNAAYNIDGIRLSTNEKLDVGAAKTQKGIYDAKFLEEQYDYQGSPKRRRQTLQEFVLLFFYISFAILTIALMIYAYLENGNNITAAAKVFGFSCIIALAMTGVLVKVA